MNFPVLYSGNVFEWIRWTKECQYCSKNVLVQGGLNDRIGFRSDRSLVGTWSKVISKLTMPRAEILLVGYRLKFVFSNGKSPCNSRGGPVVASWMVQVYMCMTRWVNIFVRLLRIEENKLCTSQKKQNLKPLGKILGTNRILYLEVILNNINFTSVFLDSTGWNSNQIFLSQNYFQVQLKIWNWGRICHANNLKLFILKISKH